MKPTSTFNRLLKIVLLLTISTQIFAQSFTETFLDMPTVTTTGGWVVTNNTAPVGTATWRQGENTTLVGGFLSYDNALVSGYDYATCDYNSGSGLADISNWLISPAITTLSNGDTINFYTRTNNPNSFADRMQVRVSTNGTSTNVGATTTSVGDFTTLLFDINPTLDTVSYPKAWTLYSVVLSGLPAGNLTGRIAFRYFVTGGGPSGANSLSVGVDLAHYGNVGGGGGGTLTTGTISPSTYCVGSSINVPFTSSGITFTAGNIFTAQLSDANGSFAAPVSIGTLNSTATSGTVVGTIPTNTQPGAFYRVRVVASAPNTIGTQNSANFYISRNYPPTLFANPGTTVCSGGTVSLSAVPFERFYGFEAVSGQFVRFNSATPGTLTNVGPVTTANFFAGDFGPDGYYVIDATTNAYGKVDLNTAVVTNVGTSTPLSGDQWTGLAWNPARSQFYATAINATVDTSRLYAVNFANGAATLIGNMTNVAGAIWLAIANNGATYALDIVNDEIYGISLTTGAGTLVGAIGFDANFAQDADFDPTTGILYMAAYNATSAQAELRTVNTTTGATTLVGGLGAIPANIDIDALAIAGYSSYSWSTGATTSSINVTTSNTYTVTVTNPTGCTASASQVISVGNASVSISPSNPSVCNGNSVALTASGANSYVWSNGGTTATINVSATGTYTVTATGNGGCTATATVTVSAGTAPTAGITPANPTVCQGSSVTLTATGGGTYLWSNGSSTATTSVSNTGTYTVTVTGNGGCTASASVNVGTGTPPTASISPSNPTVCSPNTVTLTASGGGTYLWSNGLGTNATVNISNTGNYSVTVTGNGGCTASATVSVGAGTPPTASISPSNPTVCAGNQITLTASGGGTYLWSNGLGTNAAVNVSNTGTYSVTVTGNGGCTASATVSVGTGTAPSVSISPSSPAVCGGGSVLLTATGANTYVWSTGGNTPSITVSNTGLYTVTATGNGGCTATASVTVGTGTAPTATITPGGNTVFCQGGSVMLTAGGGSTYSWSNGATTAATTATSSGLYVVTVTAANGCTATASQSVTANPAPSAAITANGSTTLCPGGSVQLTASGGTSYNWSSGQNTAIITVTTANTYTVTVTNANTCTATATQIVTLQNTTASITPSGSTALCPNASVTLTASQGASYLWSNNQTSSSISASAPGNYTVTVTFAGGCTASASQQVTSASAPTAAISLSGPATFCIGQSVTLTASGGTGYSWSNGSTIAAITVNSSGSYTVTVSNSSGCTATASQTVTQSVPSASISASGNTTFCSGSSINLTANGGATYLWSNGAATATIPVSSTGIYTVTATDANTCTATASQTVIVNVATATITPSGPTTFCPGGNVTLTANSASGFLWSTGAQTISINALTAAIYTVTVTDGNGCTASASQTVTVDANPTATITPSGNGTICSNGSETLTATSGLSYSWSTGSTSQSVTATTGGIYNVTVVLGAGCSASASQTVTQLPAISISGTTTSSTGSNGAVDITITNGVAPLGFAWSNAQTTEDITGLAAGSYSVTVTDAEGCTATSSFAVAVNVGIASVGNITLFNVFPNPAQNAVQVQVQLNEAANAEVRVTDIYGKLIYAAKQNAASAFTLNLDASMWAAGVYNVEVATAKFNTAKKLVVIK